MKRKIIYLSLLLAIAYTASFSQNLVYSTFFGGSDEDIPDNMTIEKEGNIYISGTTKSDNFPVTSGAYDESFNGGISDFPGKEDIYVMKFNTNSNQIEYCTYIGGAQGPDFAWSMKIDDLGNVYLGGNTGASDFPVTPGAYNTVYDGTGERHEMGFLTKINADGSQLLFSTFFPGVSDFELDDEGNIYIIGNVNEEVEVTNDAFDTTFNGGSDLYIAKLNADATILDYATFIGGSGDESASECLYLDEDLNLYFAGATTSDDFPITQNAFDTTYNGKSSSLGDGYVGKFNLAENKLEFLSYIGGSKDDEVTCLKVYNGLIYIAGRTVSTDFPVTESAYDTTYNGGSFDFFVAILSSATGELIASTYLGGGKFENQRNISVDNAGNIVFTGNTNSTNFPVTPNAYNLTYNGGSSEEYWMGDIVLLKMPPELNKLIYSTYIGGSNDEHSAQVICDKSGELILTGATKSSNFPVTANALDNNINGDRDIFIVKFNPEATDVREINHHLNFNVFPNPSSNTILIKTGDISLEGANYKLTDINGKTIKQGKLESETIDISGLPKGVYMLRLNTNEGIITEKIVIE